MYGYFACMYVYATHACGVCGDQKRAWEPLELEMDVNCYMGSKFRISARATRVLSHRAKSLVPRIAVFFLMMSPGCHLLLTRPGAAASQSLR